MPSITIVTITLVIRSPMSADSFLLNYLYGPATAVNGWRSAGTAELPAIPGRRAPGHLAKRFSQVMVSLMTDALAPYGLTPSQWGVMVAIIREPGTDQRRVAERQGIDANSASRLIDELEELGLVRRVAAPNDRRSNQLELTASGRRLRAKAVVPVIAAQDGALACLDEAEKTTLLDLLTRVVEANMAHARPGVGRRKPVRRSPPLQPAPTA
jgi:MarR family transcriptional regulator, temperature-dependent positive regulator of motility